MNVQTEQVWSGSMGVPYGLFILVIFNINKIIIWL